MDYEAAEDLGNRAMCAMHHYMVPPTPANFAVWFHYHLGAPEALKRTIDIVIANKRSIDASVSRDLFSMYVATTKVTAGVDLQQRIAGVIENAQRYLATAIADNRQHIRTLDGLADQVTPDGDPRLLIEQLVAQLSLATDRATALESGFAATTSELDEVRRCFDEAEERSKTDALTGLANRRSLDAFMRTTQIDAMEKDEPFSVLLLDIDHFKRFNDSYGHQTGDQVLRLVANTLKDNLRDGDFAARYGGEELMAVLPRTTLKEAFAVAERIRTALLDRNFRRRSTGEKLTSITASLGAAQFWPGESVEALIARCDGALYTAKRTGRNKTVAAVADFEAGSAA